MKLKVLNDVCIGCGACQAICPECFELNDDGIAEVIVKKIEEEIKEDAIDAKEGCPVSAIVEDKEEIKEDAIDAKEGCPVSAIVEDKEEIEEKK